MSKKLGVIKRSILKMKLRLPQGITLNEGETAAIIDVWKDDQRTLEKNYDQLETASDGIERTLKYKLPDAIQATSQAKSESLRFYKITKDPIKKREWARRLVIADRAITSIKGSEKRMRGMTERIKTLVEDASLEKHALDIRIAEAEAYQKMGSGLHLVGESLIDARTRAKSSKVEFRNLELGIEAIERTVKKKKDADIIAEAEAIASPTQSHYK